MLNKQQQENKKIVTDKLDETLPFAVPVWQEIERLYREGDYLEAKEQLFIFLNTSSNVYNALKYLAECQINDEVSKN